MSCFLTLDLETTLDPAMPAYVSRQGGEAFPPAPYWEVACVGALWANAECMAVRIGTLEADNEADRLRALVGIVEARKPNLVTFNGRGFDLPVLAARTMRHGLPFPRLWSREVSHRYSSDGHLDVADALTNFGAGRNASLDAWSRLIGLPGKMGTAGEDVAGLMAAGRVAEVAAYCMTDVVSTWALSLRWKLSCGMAMDKYTLAVESLLRAVDATAGLEAFASAIDRSRLLCRATEA